MEERKHTQKTVKACETKDLIHLVNVRAHVVMTEHNALWLTRAAAGENDCREVIEAGRGLSSKRALEQADGQKPSHQKSRELFGDGRRARHKRPPLPSPLLQRRRGRTPNKILQKHRFDRDFELHLFEKRFRGDDGFDVALMDARG